ncbi:MAG: ubiquitin carboxyl-terminal hydrolase family protein [Chlamydiota bacterium]
MPFKTQVIWKGYYYTVSMMLSNNSGSELEPWIQKQLIDTLSEIDNQRDSTICSGADQFSIEFTKTGIIAQNSSDTTKTIKIDTRRTLELSTEICQTIDAPKDTLKKVVQLRKEGKFTPNLIQEKVSSSSRAPSNSPLPYLTHTNNSCWLAAVTWTYLLDPAADKQISEAIDRLVVSDEENPREKSQKLEALLFLNEYIRECQKCQQEGRKVSGNVIEKLRNVFSALDPKEFGQSIKFNFKDAHAALTILDTLIFNGAPDLSKISLQRTVDASRSSPERPEIENGNIISVGLPQNPNTPLVNILQAHFNSEQNYPIGTGSEERRVTHERRQWETPPQQLHIQLKRFFYENGLKKIDLPVDCPFSLNLDAAYFQMGANDGCQYQLSGVYLHSAGHYTSLIVKEDPQHTGYYEYYHCDDKAGKIEKISPDEAKRLTDTQGYVLKYTKKTPAPSSNNSSSSTSNTLSRQVK